MSAEQCEVAHQDRWRSGDTGKAMQENVLFSLVDQILKFACCLVGSSCILIEINITHWLVDCVFETLLLEHLLFLLYRETSIEMLDI